MRIGVEGGGREFPREPHTCVPYPTVLYQPVRGVRALVRKIWFKILRFFFFLKKPAWL